LFFCRLPWRIYLTIVVCLVGTHFRRPFDGIRFWSKRQGITQLYLLYSNAQSEDETAIFSYMSRRNAESLKERLEIMDPIMVGYDPMDHRDAFRTLYKIFAQARKDGEEILVDITSTTNLTQGVALTITLMFRNARANRRRKIREMVRKRPKPAQYEPYGDQPPGVSTRATHQARGEGGGGREKSP
jgi:hypothetical protein